MKALCLSLGLVAGLPLTAPALAQSSPQPYAVYTTAATDAPWGTPVAACAVVNVILWNGVTPYSPPPYGNPPVATALIAAGPLQIGQTVTGVPPTCP